jgi:diaminopimelate epimerase
MRFAKYHGLGNDFLVVDLRHVPAAEAEAAQTPASVIAVCDRQFGVGGDGVLAVLPSSSADIRMRVLNSDGSEAEMCGNGIRCVAKDMFDRGGLRKPEITIDTGAGRLTCAIDAEGSVARSVTVAMGRPRLLRGEIPMTGPAGERCIGQPLEIAGVSRLVTCVSMGNPHAVTFVDERSESRGWGPDGFAGGAGARPREIDSREDTMKLATTIGPAIERHAWFPRRTNAEFAYVKSRTEIDLAVWERGCGITLACGTGACATAVAAILTGRADEATPIRVNLPGGTLEITVMAGLTEVAMKGPARHVFDSEVALDQLELRPR